MLSHLPAVSSSLSSVHSPEVLRARAENVSSLQLLRFISLHAAAGSHHGCSHTGLQPLPGSTKKPRHKWVLLLLYFTHSLQLNTVALLECLSFVPPVAPIVRSSKTTKRCSLSWKSAWPVSPAENRTSWDTSPRRPLRCLSCWLRCKCSNSSYHHWKQAAPGFMCSSCDWHLFQTVYFWRPTCLGGEPIRRPSRDWKTCWLWWDRSYQSADLIVVCIPFKSLLLFSNRAAPISVSWWISTPPLSNNDSTPLKSWKGLSWHWILQGNKYSVTQVSFCCCCFFKKKFCLELCFSSVIFEAL